MSDKLQDIVDQQTLLKVDYASRAGFLRDYAENIGQGGTMMRTARRFQNGESVTLQISFPGLLRSIVLDGVVQWTRQEDANEFVIGVQFRKWIEETREALAYLVKRIELGDKEIVLPHTMRILVVEDNEHVAMMIRRGLETYQRREGGDMAFETLHATNGHEALNMLEKENYDLLIVDIFMPILDGESLIRTLRQSPQWRCLPIIALSAGGSDIEPKVLEAGANVYLEKPIRLNDILFNIRKLMESEPVMEEKI